MAMFELEIVTNGYDLTNEDLMSDLSDVAKERFTDDEKKVLQLLDDADVELVESFRHHGENVYRFASDSIDLAAAGKEVARSSIDRIDLFAELSDVAS